MDQLVSPIFCKTCVFLESTRIIQTIDHVYYKKRQSLHLPATRLMKGEDGIVCSLKKGRGVRPDFHGDVHNTTNESRTRVTRPRERERRKARNKAVSDLEAFTARRESTQNKLALNDVEASTLLLRYAIPTLHESALKSLRRRRRPPPPSSVSSRSRQGGRARRWRTSERARARARARAGVERGGRTIWPVQKAQN